MYFDHHLYLALGFQREEVLNNYGLRSLPFKCSLSCAVAIYD